MENHGTETVVKDNITAETKINDLQQELSDARSRGDRPAEAKALADLGTAYGWGGEYAEENGQGCGISAQLTSSAITLKKN
ncbi:MAG: hypothetical protein GDA38_09130 [Hormoscilla sp. SP12CHS1]|nr:hypothetical protein [Hormoscilla sp. SP12CHS1]